jgi:very-short-patch-repair endonuclease
MPEERTATMKALRDALAPTVHSLATLHSHAELDGVFKALGLPTQPPPEEEGRQPTKWQRVEHSWSLVTEESLPSVAEAFLASGELEPRQRNAVEDALWSTQSHPTIDKRTRHEIAAALGARALWQDPDGFWALLHRCWVLVPELNIFLSTLAGGHQRDDLEAQIRQHVFRNDDWDANELFRQVGAFEASDRRFGLWLEGLVSPEVLPNEEAQGELVTLINPPLQRSGSALEVVGTSDGYPDYRLQPHGGRPKGRPKNIIFATTARPDLRLIDALDNDVEGCSDPKDVLIYDRPLDFATGLTWADLQDWWAGRSEITDPGQAKSTLYQRLCDSLPTNSPPQRNFFRAYHEFLGNKVPQMPALLPEVWLLWDPKTVAARRSEALLNQRMDFVMLLPGHRRLVLEVDGKNHYAKGDKADPETYAATMKGDRQLRLKGYEVYRFGAAELLTLDQTHSTISEFFTRLPGFASASAGR